MIESNKVIVKPEHGTPPVADPGIYIRGYESYDKSLYNSPDGWQRQGGARWCGAVRQRLSGACR